MSMGFDDIQTGYEIAYLVFNSPSKEEAMDKYSRLEVMGMDKKQADYIFEGFLKRKFKEKESKK
jgi:hypothetical protein